MAIDRRTTLAALIVSLLPPAVFAHGDAHKSPAPGAKAEQKPFGIAGDPKRVTRTVRMELSDAMRFHPATLEVKRGDTVRFVLRNSGKVMHELVIGTKEELDAHAALMKKFPDMEHDDPWMAHVKPGETGELVWNFNRAGTFSYACLIAGHFEAGMVGKVTVK